MKLYCIWHIRPWLCCKHTYVLAQRFLVVRRSFTCLGSIQKVHESIMSLCSPKSSFLMKYAVLGCIQSEHRWDQGDGYAIVKSPIFVYYISPSYRPKEARTSKTCTTAKKTAQFYPLALLVGSMAAIFMSLLNAFQKVFKKKTLFARGFEHVL